MKRDPVVIIVVAMVVSLMLVFGLNMARKASKPGSGVIQTAGGLAPDFALQ